MNELTLIKFSTIKFSTFIALRDLIPFLQFKKREKYPWGCSTFSKVPATLLKVTLLHGCFWRFLNCTNDTKSRKATHIVFSQLVFNGYPCRELLAQSINRRSVLMW